MWMKWLLEFLVFYKERNLVKILCLFFCFSFLSVEVIHGKKITYKEALELKKKNHYEKAEKAFLQLLKKDGNNSELWFQLGLVQRFQKKFSEALKSQKKALTLSPKSFSIRLEVGRIYNWTGKYSSAKKIIQGLLVDYPKSVEARKLLAVIDQVNETPLKKKKLFWNLDFGHKMSRLSRVSQTNWNRSFLHVGYQATKKRLFYLKLENEKRGDISNRYYEASMLYKFNKKYNTFVSFGYSPNHSFLQEFRLKAGGDFNFVSGCECLGDSWFTLDLQYDEYKNNIEVGSIKPGLRYFIFKKLSVEGQYIRIFDNTKITLEGWLVRLDWNLPINGLALFSGLSEAPETENSVSVLTKSYFGGLSYQTTPQVTLRASYANEDSENSYIRDIIDFSLSVKFE